MNYIFLEGRETQTTRAVCNLPACVITIIHFAGAHSGEEKHRYCPRESGASRRMWAAKIEARPPYGHC